MKYKKLNCSFLVYLFALTSLCISATSLKSQDLYFPPIVFEEWQNIKPEAAGYCQENIDSLYDFLEENNTKAFLLLKDGKIVLEKYFGNFTKDSSWYWSNAAHSLTASLVGIAQSENLLSTEDKVHKYLNPEWNQPEYEDIKIVHLLNMSSGLSVNNNQSDCSTIDCLTAEHEPGSKWNYSSFSQPLLAGIIKAASGNTINQFLFNTLRGEIGISGSFTNENKEIYSSNARSMARYALFLLAEGKWDKTSILTDTAFFNQMITPSQSMNPSFGFMNWLNGENSYLLPQSENEFSGSLNPAAPQDAYFAMGENAQLINIVPSENLVWIRMGNLPEPGNGSIPALFNNNIWKRINYLKCEQLTFNPKTLKDVEEDLFPKPGKDEIRITTKIPIQKLMIADQSGKIHFAEDIYSKKLSIDLKRFPKGIYFARIFFSDEIVSTQKFVVK